MDLNHYMIGVDTLGLTFLRAQNIKESDNRVNPMLTKHKSSKTTSFQREYADGDIINHFTQIYVIYTPLYLNKEQSKHLAKYNLNKRTKTYAHSLYYEINYLGGMRNIIL